MCILCCTVRRSGVNTTDLQCKSCMHLRTLITWNLSTIRHQDIHCSPGSCAHAQNLQTEVDSARHRETPNMLPECQHAAEVSDLNRVAHTCIHVCARSHQASPGTLPRGGRLRTQGSSTHTSPQGPPAAAPPGCRARGSPPRTAAQPPGATGRAGTARCRAGVLASWQRARLARSWAGSPGACAAGRGQDGEVARGVRD